MKKQLSILIVACAILLSSCEKEDNARKAIAGTYRFYHYEIDYYKADGITIDNSTKKELDGTIELATSNDPGSEWYNPCTYSLSEIPRGWVDNQVTTSSPLWHIDQGHGKVINFFVEPNAGNVQYATYTITPNGGKKCIFTMVRLLNGFIYYEERLYLEKQ
jgi:hypothetical protein